MHVPSHEQLIMPDVFQLRSWAPMELIKVLMQLRSSSKRSSISNMLSARSVIFLAQTDNANTKVFSLAKS